LIFVAALAGCRPDEQVSHYRVARLAQSEPSAGQSPAVKQDAILAAIVPHGGQAWFFKLAGPVEVLADQSEAFRKFVESIRFAGDEPRYDSPNGWRAKGASEMRYETLEIPTGGAPVELAISRLPKPDEEDAPFLLLNINRWRGQVGLKPIDPSQLAENVTTMPLAGGNTATLVALVGNKQPGGMTAPPSRPQAGQAAADEAAGADKPAAASPTTGKSAAETTSPDGMLGAIVPQATQAWFFKLTGPAPAVAALREPFHKFVESVRFVGGEPRFDPPDDWQPQGPSGMRHETFRIPAAGSAAGDKPLELAVTTLVKPPGDERGYLLANVNRWRNQIGLPPIDAAQLADQCERVTLASDMTATLVNLVGKLQSGGMTPPFATGK
jgi:hypothetical protein